MRRRAFGRRRFLAGATLLALAVAPAPLLAEDVSVPANLQAELLAKVAGYDKNLGERAPDSRVRVLIVTKPGDADSSRIGAQITKALASIDSIAGYSHDEIGYPYAGAAALVETCRSRRIAIAYFAPGFGADIPAIARAFDGTSILTVASIASFVPDGIVLGFDLVSGKPKLVANLTQARKQRVNLSADVLKIMKVYE